MLGLKKSRQSWRNILSQGVQGKLRKFSKAYLLWFFSYCFVLGCEDVPSFQLQVGHLFFRCFCKFFKGQRWGEGQCAFQLLLCFQLFLLEIFSMPRCHIWWTGSWNLLEECELFKVSTINCWKRSFRRSGNVNSKCITTNIYCD